MRLSLVIVAVALVAAAVPASAWEGCEPTTSQPEWEAHGFYGDWDWCQPECIWSYWVYEESNGIPGLQRGDEVVDDTCGGQIESDTIVY